MNIRNYTSADFSAILQLRQELDVLEQVDSLSTLESCVEKESLQKLLQKTSPLGNLFVAEVENVIVAYGLILGVWEEEDGVWIFLHDQFTSPNIPRDVHLEILHTLQQRINMLASNKHNLTKCICGTNVSESQANKLEFLQRDGYKIVWQMMEMEYDCSTLKKQKEPDTDFLIICPSEDLYRQIYESNFYVYKGTFGASTQISDEEYEEFLEENPDRDTWVVAMKDGDLAGFVLSHIENNIGIMNEVTVMPKYRRRGIARSLLHESLMLLQKKGVSKVRLHTDAQGTRGGRQLYEKVGFTPLKTHYRLRKEVDLR